jgi:anhydro-N-acetylmuramic acid kinase
MFVIGLISGTSVDGIDAALVEISGSTIDLQVNLIAGATYPYPTRLREQILAVCGGSAISMAELAELDDAIAFQFAQAALSIQKGHPTAALIGSHGQTVYHRPPSKEKGERKKEEGQSSCLGYSLQLGRGDLIARLTGIETVNNFRAADIAAGGHAAPLVPKIDACLLGHPHKTRCIQNIGGIGNVTYLPAQQSQNWEDKIVGWDTGPGNSLLDLAVQQLSNGAQTYDEDGRWAASGTPYQPLVEQWLQHEYFHQPPPKSTGRELFGLEFLQSCMADARSHNLSAADILATLTEFTVASIAHSYRTFLPQLPEQVLLGGGGSRNLYMKQRLQALLAEIPILTTESVGLSADFKEAIAFAVLAYWRKHEIPGNLPSVTGATQAIVLGEIHPVISA